MKFKHPYCVIRKGLNTNRVNIPIWDNENCLYIHGSNCRWRYRRLGDVIFQIKYGDKYYNAYSIHFDFINP